MFVLSLCTHCSIWWVKGAVTGAETAFSSDWGSAGVDCCSTAFAHWMCLGDHSVEMVVHRVHCACGSWCIAENGAFWICKKERLDDFLVAGSSGCWHPSSAVVLGLLLSAFSPATLSCSDIACWLDIGQHGCGNCCLLSKCNAQLCFVFLFLL